jgi:hypothetical protein
LRTGTSVVGIILTLAILAAGQPSTAQLQKRTPYDVKLARLSLSFEDHTERIEQVRVSLDGSSDYAIISPTNDEFIKMDRDGREKTVYREALETAWLVSDFEREQLLMVTRGLIEALTQFEHDLQRQRFDKCLYLDGYLPRFLRGYYFLCESIRSNQDALPRVARVPESAFDVSLNSPKSDERISAWNSSAENSIKLRIVTKEFIHHLKLWEKEFAKSKESQDSLFNNELKKVYSLFIRIYFNLNPPPRIATGD